MNSFDRAWRSFFKKTNNREKSLVSFYHQARSLCFLNAIRMLKNKHDAEDIASKVINKFILEDVENNATWENNEPERTKKALIRRTKNECINLIKQQKNRQRIGNGLVKDLEKESWNLGELKMDNLEYNETIKKVIIHFLARLSKAQKKVARLHTMPHSRIAEELNISVSTVESHITEIRKIAKTIKPNPLKYLK